MAEFILEVGEVEEHTHDQETRTTLIEGSADLIIDNERQPLQLGKTLTVPANVPHKIVNTGNSRVIFGCRC